MQFSTIMLLVVHIAIYITTDRTANKRCVGSIVKNGAIQRMVLENSVILKRRRFSNNELTIRKQCTNDVCCKAVKTRKRANLLHTEAINSQKALKRSNAPLSVVAKSL